MVTAVIASAVRTPVRTVGGALRDTPATALRAHAARTALERAQVPGDENDEAPCAGGGQGRVALIRNGAQP